MTFLPSIFNPFKISQWHTYSPLFIYLHGIPQSAFLIPSSVSASHSHISSMASLSYFYKSVPLSLRHLLSRFCRRDVHLAIFFCGVVVVRWFHYSGVHQPSYGAASLSCASKTALAPTLPSPILASLSHASNITKGFCSLIGVVAIFHLGVLVSPCPSRAPWLRRPCLFPVPSLRRPCFIAASLS